jgi:hypothetical protein
MHSRAVPGLLLKKGYSLPPVEAGSRLRIVYLLVCWFVLFSFDLFSFDQGNISSAG